MILPLSELISRAVERSLEDRVAISFSGGVDSTVIAAIAGKHADVELFTSGMEGSEDMEFAGRAAKQMGIPLVKVPLDEGSVLETFGMCHALLPMDLLKVEILVPVYKTAEAAARKGHRTILFGTAAEELFVGYERYFLARDEGADLPGILEEEFRTLAHREISWIGKVCKKHGIEARFPLYDRKIWEYMSAVPIEERMSDRELKKPQLREAAKLLGVPDFVLKRRKRAMQYASGIHKVIMRHAAELDAKYPPKP